MFVALLFFFFFKFFLTRLSPIKVNGTFNVLLLILNVASALECSNKEILDQVTKGSFLVSKAFTKYILEKKLQDNVVCSALSINFALALAAYGMKKGSLQEQLYEALKFCTNDVNKNLLELDGKKSHSHKKIKNNSELNTQNVTLIIDNKIHVVKDYELTELRETIGNDTFNAMSLKKINNWITTRVNNKTTSFFLYKDDVNETSSLVLLNTIDFNAKWKYPFYPVMDEKDFYNLKNEKHPVFMMVLGAVELKSNYLPELQSIFYELPFMNEDYRMYIISPRSDQINADIFYEIGKKLQTFDYKRLYSISDTYVANFLLPTFTIQSIINFNEVLKYINTTALFNKTDVIDDIVGAKSQSRLTEIIQKTIITVDVEGVKSSFITSSSINNTFVPVSTELPLRFVSNTIIIDSAFYFAIVSSEGMLFQGQVTDPNQS